MKICHILLEDKNKFASTAVESQSISFKKQEIQTIYGISEDNGTLMHMEGRSPGASNVGRRKSGQNAHLH